MKQMLINAQNIENLLIEDGIIRSIDTSMQHVQECEQIDCSGCIIWPGLIDSHVHFRTPGEEYKEDWNTGSAAALAGGVTTVVDMPNNKPSITTSALFVEKRACVLQNATIDFRLTVGVTDQSFDAIIDAEREAVAIKVYMGMSTGGMVMAQSDALEYLFAHTTKLLMIHAEDEQTVQKNAAQYEQNTNCDPSIHSRIRSKEAAIIATQRALELAKKYQRTIYFCHISTKEEIELIEQARRDGIQAYIEVTPHHLFLHEESYTSLGTFAKVNPPLRTRADNDALWEAIRTGIVDVIATDHAPHTIEEKQQSYWKAPAGMPGIELLFPLLLTASHEGKITLEDIQRCCISNPANIFGCEKEIAVGKKADMVIFNPSVEWVVERNMLHSKCGWSPYEGWKLTGKVIRTIKQL